MTRGAMEVKADISLVRAAETLVIDVSCLDPGADQYLLTPIFSFRVQDGAGRLRVWRRTRLLITRQM